MSNANFMVLEDGKVYFEKINIGEQVQIKKSNEDTILEAGTLYENYLNCRRGADLKGLPPKATDLYERTLGGLGTWFVGCHNAAERSDWWTSRDELGSPFFTYYTNQTPEPGEKPELIGSYYMITGDADCWVEADHEIIGDWDLSDITAYNVLDGSTHKATYGNIVIEEYRAGYKRKGEDNNNWCFVTEIDGERNRNVPSYLRYPLRIRIPGGGQFSSLVLPLPDSGETLGFQLRGGSINEPYRYLMDVNKELGLQLIKIEGSTANEIVICVPGQDISQVSRARQKGYYIEPRDGEYRYPIMRIGFFYI